MKTNANIAGIKPAITGTLMLQNGTAIPLRDRDFKADTFTIKDGTSNGSEFTVGGAVIGSLEFTLINDTGRFSNLDWFDSKVSLALESNGTVLNFDSFWVVKHHEIGKLITVECYDALKILDEYAIYELNLTFPTTVSAIITAMASSHNFTVSGLANGSVQVDDPGNDQMTQRACLSYLAQLTGQFVKAHGTELAFGWYDMNTQHQAGTTFSHDLRTDNITITGVSVTDKSDTTSQTRGTSAYQIEINDNPFIDSNNISQVADIIYAAVNGISYRPGDVSIKSNPAIEAGDVLVVNTGEEQGIVILATNITYKPQLQERITADAEPYAGDLRISRSAYIKRQAKQAISEELQDSSSDLSQAIGDGGGASVTMRVFGTIPTSQSDKQYKTVRTISSSDASDTSFLYPPCITHKSDGTVQTFSDLTSSVFSIEVGQIISVPKHATISDTEHSNEFVVMFRVKAYIYRMSATFYGEVPLCCKWSGDRLQVRGAYVDILGVFKNTCMFIGWAGTGKGTGKCALIPFVCNFYLKKRDDLGDDVWYVDDGT